MLGNNIGRALLVALVLLLMITGCGNDLTNAERIERAQQHVDKKEYRAAIIELKNALQNDAADNQARLALAEVYIATRQAPSAEKEIRKVKSPEREGERAVSVLAEALVLQGDFSGFIEKIKIKESFSPKAKEKLYLQRAKVYAAQGDIKRAESEYNAILSRNPAEVQALSGLALIDFSREAFTEGLERLDQAIKLDPRFADAWRLKGAVFNKQGKYKESEEAYRKSIALYKEKLHVQEEFRAHLGLIKTLLVLKKGEVFASEVEELEKISADHPMTLYFSALNDFLNKRYTAAENKLSPLVTRVPDHLPSLLLLGSVQYALAKYEQANTHLTKFVKNVPTHIQARKILGATRLKLNLPEDALEVLTPIAGADVDDAQILAMVGRAVSQGDQADLAQSFYKRASKASPENYQLREELAKSYLQRGEFDNAIETLNAASGDDELRAKLLIVYAHLKKRDLRQAKSVFDEINSKFPEEERVQLVGATIDLLDGKRAEARVKLIELEKKNSKDLRASFAIAKIDMEDGEIKRARERFSRIYESDETNTQVMVALAQLEEQAGSSEKSLMWLEQARKVDKNARVPRLILARYYLKSKQLNKSLAVTEELLSIDKKSGRALVQHAAVLLAMDKPNEAAIVYEKITEYFPKQNGGYLALAKIYTSLGKKSEASAVLTRMELTIKNEVVAALARIEMELQSKNPDKAIKLASQLIDKHPENYAAHLLMANGKKAKGDNQGAIKSLKNAVKYSERKEPILQLAQLLFQQNKKKMALTELAKWLKVHKNHEVRFFRASILQSMGDLKNAAADYEKIIEVDTTNPLVLNNLALIYLESDIKKSLSIAELAIKRADNVPEILDTHGWVLIADGQFDRGVEQLQKAFKASKNSEIRYHLAYGLEKQGKNEEARSHVSELLSDKTLSANLEKQVKALQKTLLEK